MINLEKEIKFWQEILSLKDWEIEIQWSSQQDMPIEGAAACISSDFDNAKARIWVLKMTVPVTSESTLHTRENIVHELLHIHLERWDEKTPDVDRHRERAINQIAKGLVSLYELNSRPGSPGDSVSIAGKPNRRGIPVTRAGGGNKTGSRPAKPSN